MKKRNRMVLGILLVVLSLTVTPKAAFAENKTVTVIEVGNEADFDKAISTVNNASEGEYVISLTDDMDIGGVSIQSQCPVTLLGNGHTLTVAQYASIHVEKGAQVNLGSEKGNVLKIRGVNEMSNDVPGLLYIQGTCDMYSGVSLSDREGNNYFGGGVTVEGGTFYMHGGVIERCGINGGSVCYGGGVAVIYGGQFIMDGGEIRECYADSDSSKLPGSTWFTGVGGGVFVSGGSSFVMNGGTILKNKATSMGGGIAVMASIEEIVDGGWGNLQSMVEIKKGGTVKNNSAQTGAGVFASASYYCPVYAICAPTPAIGQSANPGLYIDNAQILDNVAPISSKDKDVKYHNKKDHPAYGMGGGLFVAGLKSPAGVHVGNNTVIRGNKAAVGGGFAAKQNTYDGQLTITNTVLCNNIAERAASDVYLDHAPLKLPSAEKMNALYLGEPDDVYDQIIDGWYIDGEDLRYTARTKEQRTTYAGAGDAVIGGTGEVCLIAAAKPSLAKITFTDEDGSVTYAENWHPHGTPAHQIQAPKAEKASDDTYDYIFEAWSPEIQHVTGHATYKATFKRVFRKFNAKYQFNSVSDDERLPDEVKALLPADTTDYRHEQNITAIAPSKTVVEVEGGQWVFKGFEKETIPATMEHADETGNVTFVAHWEFVRTTPKFEDDINLPQTGDNSDIALWSALLAVSAAVLIGMAFRGHQKKTR